MWQERNKDENSFVTLNIVLAPVISAV